MRSYVINLMTLYLLIGSATAMIIADENRPTKRNIQLIQELVVSHGTLPSFCNRSLPTRQYMLFKAILYTENAACGRRIFQHNFRDTSSLSLTSSVTASLSDILNRLLMNMHPDALQMHFLWTRRSCQRCFFHLYAILFELRH